MSRWALPLTLGLGTAAMLLAARSVEGGALASGVTLFPRLARAAFPGGDRPGAAVRVPPGFDPSAPLDLAIYLHGHDNCVTRLVLDRDGPCQPGGRTQGHSGLVRQFDAAGVNAIFVMPQLRWEVATGDPGELRRAGGIEALVDELLAGPLGALAAGRRSADVRHVALMGHSGGYLAMSAMLRAGAFGDRLMDVVLLDALYAESSVFEQWARDRASSRRPYRLANIYTATGGTATQSRAMRDRLHAAGDDTPRDDPPAGYSAARLVQRSRFDHAGVSRYYPERFWRTAGFGRRRGAP